MADPQVGDTRVVPWPGIKRKTLKGVTKYDSMAVFHIRQIYTHVRSFKNIVGDDVRSYSWVDDEFVDAP